MEFLRPSRRSGTRRGCWTAASATTSWSRAAKARTGSSARMNDWTPRELEIDLASFLPPATGHVRRGHGLVRGRCRMLIACRPATRRESTPVTARPRIKVKLAPGGGWAARITRGSVFCKRDVGAGAAPPAPR